MQNFKYSYNKEFFKNIDSEEKAYWLGFLYADGCINERAKSQNLELTLCEQDKNHLYKLRQAINGDMPINLKQVKLKGKTFNSYRLQICSTDLCDDLITLGCVPNKSLLLQFPDFLEDELYKHFIRGYLDGDGCISTRCRISICGTYDFLADMQKHFIDKLGVTEVSILSDKRRNHYQYERVGKNSLKILKYLYEDSKVYLDRKYDKAIAYLNSNIQSKSTMTNKVKTERAKSVESSLERV